MEHSPLEKSSEKLMDNAQAYVPLVGTMPHSQKITMKVLANLIGRVNVFNPSPDFSYVTLKNIDNGEVIDSNAVTDKLVEIGITKVDEEFQVLVYEDDNGKQMATISKLNPKPVVQEQVDSIVKEVDETIGDFNI